MSCLKIINWAKLLNLGVTMANLFCLAVAMPTFQGRVRDPKRTSLQLNGKLILLLIRCWNLRSFAFFTQKFSSSIQVSLFNVPLHFKIREFVFIRWLFLFFSAVPAKTITRCRRKMTKPLFELPFYRHKIPSLHPKHALRCWPWKPYFSPKESVVLHRETNEDFIRL